MQRGYRLLHPGWVGLQRTCNQGHNNGDQCAANHHFKDDVRHCVGRGVDITEAASPDGPCQHDEPQEADDARNHRDPGDKSRGSHPTRLQPVAVL